MRSRLTELQQALLQAFFEDAGPWFLTGGAALSGYLLGHRETHDLDLFTVDADIRDGDGRLEQAAKRLGATIRRVRTAPGFARRLVERAGESVVVDLVVDPPSASAPERRVVGGVVFDDPGEILANKLCALLGRMELRDLVDTKALLDAGLDLEVALARAMEKDGGLTPAQLAWVLSRMPIAEDEMVPGGESPASLRAWSQALQQRLIDSAVPDHER